MTNNAQEFAATIFGAVIGGVAGYLFFTDRGRAIRRQIEPAIDDLSRELSSLRVTVGKVARVANQGRNLLDEVVGESGSQSRYAAPHQSSPF